MKKTRQTTIVVLQSTAQEGGKLLGPASNSCGARSDFIASVEVS